MPIRNAAEVRTPGVPQFGQNATYVFIQKIALDSALDAKEFNLTGTFFYIIDASSKTVKANIQFESQSNGSIPVQQGSFLSGIRYDKLYITANAVAGGYITIMGGVETEGRVQALNPADQFNDISIIKSTKITPTPAWFSTAGTAPGATLMVAANATRRRMIVSADPGNSAGYRVGGSDVDATHGVYLTAGQSMEVLSTDAFYIFDDSIVATDKFHFYAEYD